MQKVVVMKGAQVGYTEAGNNWLGYIIDHAPGPILAVQPTIDVARRFSRQRLDTLLEDSPRLAAKVVQRSSRQAANSTNLKEFPSGMLLLTGANSAAGLRMITARYLFLDEVDAFAIDADGEGDPILLARRSTRTFGTRSKMLMGSTPTSTGTSRIEQAYEQSDQSVFMVTCPDCDREQEVKWPAIIYEKDPDDPTRVLDGSVGLRCQGCAVLIPETQKRLLLEGGRWVAKVPSRSSRVRGFHISGLLAPPGWFSWTEAAELWLEAKGKPEQLRVFVNQVLGETFRETGEMPDWKVLFSRREPYRLGTVPEGGLVLTAGADVQADRIEVEVVAWGPERESWSVDYVVIPGDPAEPDPWHGLEQVLKRPYPMAGQEGRELRIKLAAIDAGYLQTHVVEACRRIGRYLAIPIKGRDKYPQLIGPPTAVEVKRAGKRIKRGGKLWPLGTDIAKHELYANLRQMPPAEGERTPNGFAHFPEYAEEYFRQLCAEQCTPHVVKGSGGAAPRRVFAWEKIRERNEALDCRVYARAAAAIVGVDRWGPEDWLALASGAVSENTPKGKPETRKPKLPRRTGPIIDPNKWRGRPKI